jgi:hypothetical protein
MTNQINKVQIKANDRFTYVKPSLETHLDYKAIVGKILQSIPNFIGQPIDLISNPGLELIPDPVDIEF